MGISAALGSSALLPAGLGFRNLITNGNMSVNQRGYTSASPVSVADGTKNYYSVDRFYGSGETSQGTFSLGQSTTVYPSSEAFAYSLVATCTAADTSVTGSDDYEIGHGIEGYNAAVLGFGSSAAKQCVLTFWVRSSLTGTYCVAIRNGSANRSYIAEYSISVADTWEKKTIYFNGDTTGTWAKDNSAGMYITWALAIGGTYQTSANTWTAGNYLATSNQVNWMSSSTSRTFYLTGVQLEQNYQPTPFEQRPYGVELQLCQRYFVKQSGGWWGIAQVTPANLGYWFFILPVVMRTAVTGIVTTGSFLALDNTGIGRGINITFGDANTNRVGMQFNSGFNLATGNAAMIFSSGACTIETTGTEL